ncbi:MAG TPA: FlgO family outer membrane protein [bacterium]|nr:FlgO family outer membrane protein [bacterium]
MIGKTISHYKILEKLGEGGMGVVYKAEDIHLERLAALKFLPPHVSEDSEEKARFIHEAKSASALNHPNVTTIYGIEDSPEGLFIAMEYVDGKTLRQVIKDGPLPLKKVLDIATQICEGMAAAHEKGVVHRDIKSENIMVTARGQVKIMDFGLAKLKGASRLTQTGTTLGTIGYMSPEQASGEDVDQRSDIFSFGVVLYELLTGRQPFQGENQAAIINAIINEEPQPVARFNSQASAKLEDMVAKALAKDRDERYQHIDDLLADLRRERKSLEYARTAKYAEAARAAEGAKAASGVGAGTSPPSGYESAVGARRGLAARLPLKKLLGIGVPVAVALAVVLILFVLEPFRVEMGPKKEAVARENSIAIMYFDNLTDRADTERLGEIVTNLLITSLSESKYINVVSSQRLYDILKLLGKEGAKSIDRDVATQVATRAGARWMLLGSIIQIEPQAILTSQLVDVESGQVTASQQITGEPGEKIFPIIDRLAAGLKRDLSLPAEAQKEPEPKVADLTTSSQEAYRYYLEGRDLAYKYYNTEAKASLRKAFELDSTFAMAYLGLALVESGQERRNLAAKALKYSDRATEAERLYIKAMGAYISGDYPEAVKGLERVVAVEPDNKYAFFWLGMILFDNLQRPEEGIRNLTRAIEIDPLFKPAYNALAYNYDGIGDFEKSIWAIDKYISLAPEEANPYDSRGDLYAWNGKLDQALESYRKAIEIKPDFYMSLFKLGDMYLFKREYARAESCYKELSSCPDKSTRSGGRECLGIIPAYQGKFDEAFRVLDDGLAADRMEGAEGSYHMGKYLVKAEIYLIKKEFDLALKEGGAGVEASRKIESLQPVCNRDFYCCLLARAGRIAEAQDLAEAIRRAISGKNENYMSSYWIPLAVIEMSKKNPGAALAYLEKAAAADKSVLSSYWYRCFCARAYLEAGKLGEAVAMLEKMVSSYSEDRFFFAPMCVEDHYLLGTAYEKSGWTSKAIEQYQEFLEIWKDADPGIPSVEDARQRLAALTGKT